MSIVRMRYTVCLVFCTLIPVGLARGTPPRPTDQRGVDNSSPSVEIPRSSTGSFDDRPGPTLPERGLPAMVILSHADTVPLGGEPSRAAHQAALTSFAQRIHTCFVTGIGATVFLAQGLWRSFRENWHLLLPLLIGGAATIACLVVACIELARWRFKRCAAALACAIAVAFLSVTAVGYFALGEIIACT